MYLSGFLRKSTTSSSSIFALSQPATSENLVFVTGDKSILALDLANDSGSNPPGPLAPPPPPRPKRPPPGGPPPPRDEGALVLF